MNKVYGLRALGAGGVLLASTALASVASAQALAPVAPGAAAIGATSIDLPIVIEGRAGPSIEAAVITDRLVALNAAGLARALTGLADARIVDALRTNADANVTVGALASLGIDARFDLATLSIAITLNAASRAAQTADFAAEQREPGVDAAPAANLSAGLTGALSHIRNFGGATNNATALEYSGFANLGGKGGYYLLHSGALRIAGSEREFERGRIVAFKDDLTRTLRTSIGDLAPLMPRLVGDVALAGIGIERRYEDLQPLRNVRPTGSRSFVVERPSRIEVFADGALVRTLTVAPGPVDLRDIPALALSSNVSVIVEDSFGRRELDSFTLSNDLELLAPGLSEYSVNAGVLRDDGFSSIRYSRAPVVTGSFVRGWSDRLTAGGHVAVTAEYQNVGIDAALAALGGVVVSSASASNDGSGTGTAVTVDYRGDPFGLAGRNGQLNLRADVRSRGFRTLSLFGFADRTKFDLAADYRFDLSRRLSGNVGASYFSRYDQQGASRAAFVGAQANFDRFFLTGTARVAKRSDGESDHGLLVTLSLPVAGRHLVTASVDSASRRARADLRRRRDLDIPEFDYSVAIATDPGGTDVLGQARYGASRFEANGTLSRRFEQQASDQTQAIVRVQSGIAFADGQVAISRDPGRGFVLVSSHPSLEKTRIDVFSNGTGRRAAQVNGFGPAVVPQIAPYRDDAISFNLIDPPLGYDIGASKYRTDPGAFTGHHIRLGTEAYRSAIVILRSNDGNPLSLRYGDLTGPDGVSTPIFTNGSGRAVMNRLAPGTYAILLDGRYRSSFTIAKDSPAIIELGTLTMENAR